MQLVILIAPNASEQMGGEAMKALQIYREFKALRPNTVMVTHERNESELHNRLGLNEVIIVPDDIVSVILWRSVIFRPFLDYWFLRKAVACAMTIARESGYPSSEVVIHQVEPNSPVLPRVLATGHVNVFGPINGNIYYPDIFRPAESVQARLRRLLHFPLQRINRLVPRGIKVANLVLVAGGQRTLDSLRAAGCPSAVMLETADCGVSDRLLDQPRIQHSGENLRFIHFGRLVYHKGTALIIKSLEKTKLPIRLDIVGAGPELEACRLLVVQLSLQSRVRFLEPYRDQNTLFQSLSNYRGMALLSMEDANGMVVQEAMALGLPPICLNWGGPQLLVESGKSGYLIDPESEEKITSSLAGHLDRLGADAVLAERLSVAGRSTAGAWRWSIVASEWLNAFDKLRA